MTNPSTGVNFHNTAGVYNYDTSQTYGDYTNANNTGITANIINGADISVNNLNLNQSTLNVTNGTFTVRNAANLNTGTINVASNGSFTADGLTNLNSAKINIAGGTVTLDGNLANNNGVVIDFQDTPGGRLNVFGPNEVDDTEAITINNFAPGDSIEISDVNNNGTPTTSYSNGILTVQTGSDTYTFNITTRDGFTPTASFVTGPDGDPALLITCFLAGTLIMTPDGERPVETLRVGDEVIVLDGGSRIARPIEWIGKQTINLRKHPAPELARPVRIRENALGEGVPHKDLLVTPEHCLFIDGGLIPARMLVNGSSIISDESLTVFDIYHVETTPHSIVVSDGALSETYLDTGNRAAFRHISEGTSAVRLSGPLRSWELDAAAPLTVARETVEPIHHALAARAEVLGYGPPMASAKLTRASDLQLAIEKGQTIRPFREADGKAIFMVPGNVGSVHIVSRASKPSETVGPFLDDRRDLGVLVGAITLQEGGVTRAIDVHLTDRKLFGWHDLEDGQRWTNGNGLLPLGDRMLNSIGLLTLTILHTGLYLAPPSRELEIAASG